MDGDNLAIIDFETLDTEPTTKVLSLGVTCFHPDMDYSTYDLQNNSESWNFALEGQQSRTRSNETEAFWREQEKFVWEEHRLEPLLHPVTVIGLLTEFLRKHSVSHLVGNGKSFDNAILKNLCNEHNLRYPIHFKNDLDLRTLAWIAQIDKPKFPSGLIEHVAKHDAIAEAIAFRKYYSVIKGFRNG